jgi:hypothetical protein
MAEWGKGDPRWIVEERPDGKRKRISILFCNPEKKNIFF